MKSRILRVWNCKGHGAADTTYSKVNSAKEAKPKKSKLLRKTRRRISKKVVNED